MHAWQWKFINSKALVNPDKRIYMIVMDEIKNKEMNTEIPRSIIFLVKRP